MALGSKSSRLKLKLLAVLLLLGAGAAFFPALHPPDSWEGHLKLSVFPVRTGTNAYNPQLMQTIFAKIESAEFFKAISDEAGAHGFRPSVPKPRQIGGTSLIEVRLTADDEKACERLVRAATEELSAGFAGQIAFEVVDTAILPRQTPLQQVSKWLHSGLP